MKSINKTFPLGLLSGGRWQTHLDDSVGDKMKQLIINVFSENGIEINEVSFVAGPTVIRFELVETTKVKLRKIESCEGDLKVALSEYGPIRLIATNALIAIEVPRPDRQIVWLSEVLHSKEFQESTARLPVPLGIGTDNHPIIADLYKMPHLLIGGATGQGKSMLLHNIILSLIYKLSPDDLKFVLIDPKMVEFTEYNKISKQYLASIKDKKGYDNSVITDIDKTISALNSLCEEVDRRYSLFRNAYCRSISDYNQKIDEGQLSKNDGHCHLPYIVTIIDEFADLIMIVGKDVALPIARIALKARAVGIHIVIATQCPKADVVTGIIKVNFPCRIAFRVASMADSMTILDCPGANMLIGRGDMLFNNCGYLTRAQCAFIDTPEIDKITDYISKEFDYESHFLLPEVKDDDEKPIEVDDPSKHDPLFIECARFIVTQDTASISSMQRRFGIGYNRAGKIMVQLEAAGIVGPAIKSKPREVLTDPQSIEGLLSREMSDCKESISTNDSIISRIKKALSKMFNFYKRE